ncbi:MAG: alanine/ornithine racemase family PLP-dependent enzyme [Actinobacteria bacterium]|nr:alanine/ornithine racemase family PLP-dependent enzyme [Actinomycetota bacterium]
MILKPPYLTINLEKIKHNTRRIVEICKELSIDVIGVTKCCLGSPEVGKAMIEGEVTGLGDSRLDNLKRLSSAGLTTSLMMLRQPMINEIDEVVSFVDISLVSEIEIIRKLSAASKRAGKLHKIILMIETGDLREGFLPEELIGSKGMDEILSFDGIEIIGIGTNVACLEGAKPTPSGLKILIDLAWEIKDRYNFSIKIISGGNSSALKLVEQKIMPEEINQLRLGEGILLGQETLDFTPIAGAFQDAFILSGEVIEVKEKFRRQAIVALGRQDMCVERLFPLNKKIKIVRASSDHLVLDLTFCDDKIKISDIIDFIPSYNTLLAAMTSPFVEKRYIIGYRQQTTDNR